MLPTLLEEPSASEVGAHEGAGFGIRALARVIDTIVHILVGAAFGVFTLVLVAISGALRGEAVDAELARLSVNTPLGYVAAFLGVSRHAHSR
jgi:hypothetical protein